ncbi:hypothetical protein [Streptomyces caatingaensis]|uniref:Uncharacterized protein n=1 Tax=Streptomyces caatingaensis TaxID=1678637 RepID=A0A0K9XE37_9ACTN|nr:hypothetical protein [Streptomyces caatingaensis]KNB51498.1 hypothetical protein AC230_13995 [Streptomyces caatingaensis]
MRGRGRVIGAGVAGVALLAVSAPLGHAAAAGDGDARGFGKPAAVRQFTLGKGGRWASCTAGADAPHWSRAARSVVYATRVACKGNIPRVRVTVHGRLVRAVGSRTVDAAVSDATRTVPVDGSVVTYSTPGSAAGKARWSGRYQGVSTVRITAPVRGTEGTATSAVRYVRVP